MTYAVANDVYLAFGQSNVHKWADVNNNGLQTEIDARIAWALSEADDELNSRLAESVYQFPLGGTTFPLIVTRMAAYLAGVLLYESRGVTDVGENGKPMHALQWHRGRVDEFIRDVFARRIALINATLKDGAVAEIGQTRTAQFVSFPDPSPDRTQNIPIMEDNLIDIRP